MQIDPNELAISFGGKAAAPAAAAKSEHPRVEPEDQKAKDLERRAILETELAKKIAWLEENNRKSTPGGKKEGDAFKAQLSRAESDIESLKRELNRMGPAPAALPAAASAAAESDAAPAEKTTLGEIDPSELGGSYLEPEAESNAYKFWTPERMAAAFGGTAGALFGNPLKGDPGSMAARLAERVMGAPSGSVQDMYGAQNPSSPATLSRQLAEQRVPPVQQGALPTITPEAELTSGEKWAAKTGYGMGTGDVQDVSSRYQRASSKGRVSGKLDKLWGPKLPGEPAGLADRMIFRAQQAEAAQAAAQAAAAQAEQDSLTNEERQRREFERAQQERNRTVNQVDKSQRRAKALYDVQTGVVGKGVNVLSGALGARDLYSGLTSMFPKDEATNEYKYAPNATNVPQTVGGAAALYALRNPYVGLPVAGGAQMFGAGRDISREGKVTPETGTRAISGLGLAAMPFFPYTGLALQTPAAWNAMYEMSKENPEWFKAATGIDAFDRSKVEPKTLLPKR
jgi:hypothetical protein